MRCIIIIGLCLISSISAFSQRNYTVGILPSINLNTALPQGYKLNLNAESRQSFLDGSKNTIGSLQYHYLLTDVTVILSKRIGLNRSLAGGYLLRMEDGKFRHRSIQQFILTRRYFNFNLSQRIATDQTFSNDEAVSFRLRYRLSSEIPLNGQTVDPGEFYLKLNHEYLNAFQQGTYDLEVRLAPYLGYEISDKNKIELGLDFRINSFLEGASQSRYWTAINWYRSI